MKTDRIADRFMLIFALMIGVSVIYFSWAVFTTGPSWLHLYWIGLGAWGFYVMWHIERVLSAAREKEFKALIDDWVRRGSPDEPLDLKR